jgi:hypothetical protein
MSLSETSSWLETGIRASEEQKLQNREQFALLGVVGRGQRGSTEGKMSESDREIYAGDCFKLAMKEACISSAWALAGSGTLVSLANSFWPAFRRATTVSAKSALIVSDYLRKHPVLPGRVRRPYHFSCFRNLL